MTTHNTAKKCCNSVGINPKIGMAGCALIRLHCCVSTRAHMIPLVIQWACASKMLIEVGPEVEVQCWSGVADC